MKNSKKIIVFSRPVLDRLIINYVDKLAILGIVATAAIQVLFFPDPNIEPTRWLYILSIMLAIALIMEYGLRRFAHTISIDNEKKIIQFEMLRNKGVVETDLEKLEAIQLGFYVSFLFEGRRVFYNEVSNKELVAFLETLKPIMW